jgi:hypothetical protein
VKKKDLEQIIATGREKGVRYFVVKLKETMKPALK